MSETLPDQMLLRKMLYCNNVGLNLVHLRKSKSSFLRVSCRVLRLAYSFGGDTDTIGSMAGAVAGALWGVDAIPPDLRAPCEGADRAQEQADALHDLYVERVGRDGRGGSRGAFSFN